MKPSSRRRVRAKTTLTMTTILGPSVTRIIDPLRIHRVGSPLRDTGPEGLVILDRQGIRISTSQAVASVGLKVIHSFPIDTESDRLRAREAPWPSSKPSPNPRNCMMSVRNHLRVILRPVLLQTVKERVAQAFRNWS